MNNLKELISQKVFFDIDDETSIECKVIDVNIDDYYFEEKNEEIYISLMLEPIGEIPIDLDVNLEDFNDIPLSLIRKYK